MSRIGRGHDAHIKESCCTHGWVVLHMWMSCVVHMDASFCIYEGVMSRTLMSRVAHMNESCCQHERFKLQIWISHVAHGNESFRMCEGVMSRASMSQVAYKSCRTYEGVMSHI